MIEKIISLFTTVGILLSNSFFAIPVNVRVTGTGSMYPTFPKNPSAILMWKPIAKYTPQRGDIVSFKNEITDSLVSTKSGFIKRVIAIPGDTLELRDGQVWLNGTIISESYTALSRSTFGDNFLSDCKVIKIPENKFFVMGDNRKISDDSRRKLGLIDKNDITEILPVFLQKYTYKTRDESVKISIDKEQFLKNINANRKSPLKLSPYAKDNIATVELTIRGHYDAIELGDAAIEWWSKYFFDPKYQQVSILEIDQNINGCPTRTNVIYLGGYVPPNWDKAVIDSWQKALDSLKQFQPNDPRVQDIEEIVTLMKANKWLPKRLLDKPNLGF